MIKRKSIVLISLLAIVSISKSQNTDPKIGLADSIYYSNPDLSCKLCNEALLKAEKNSDFDIVADAKMCLARFYLLKTNYALCETNIKAAIARFKEIKSKSRLASAFNLYAILYDRLDNKQKSYDYQNEAIRLFKEIENIQGMSNMMNNLANAYIRDNRLSQAKEILDEVETYKDRISQGSLYFYQQNYGFLMYKSDKFSEALNYFNKALKIAQEQKMRDSEITASTFIAKTYIKLKRFGDAYKLLAKAEVQADTEKLDFEVEEIYQVQKELFTIQKNKIELEEVNRKIDAFKKRKEDEMKAKAKELALHDKREQELKNEMEEKRKEMMVKEAELLNQRKTNYTLPISLAAVVIIFVLVMIYRSKKRK